MRISKEFLEKEYWRAYSAYNHHGFNGYYDEASVKVMEFINKLMRQAGKSPFKVGEKWDRF